MGSSLFTQRFVFREKGVGNPFCERGCPRAERRDRKLLPPLLTKYHLLIYYKYICIKLISLDPFFQSKNTTNNMSDEHRILITFDEFFKRSSKSFFEKEGFRVETEVEIFHLPKRLDVLVVKNSLTHLPLDFTLLNFWKENNLISFKSKPDSLEIYDIWDSVLYLFGFINRNKNANLENTTMSLLVNNHPREFLKKYKDFCHPLEKGVWELISIMQRSCSLNSRKSI